MYLEIYVSAKEQDVRGTSSHSAKLRPEDVLRTSPKYVLWTSPYGPLCIAKGCPLLMFSDVLY